MFMNTVYKYPFDLADEINIPMPAGAQVLLVDFQDTVPTLWALVTPKAPAVIRRFRLVGTGHSFNVDGLKHVTSFQQPPFVWHLFEVVR